MSVRVEVTLKIRRLWLAYVWIWLMRSAGYLVGPRRAYRWAHAGATRIVRFDVGPRRGLRIAGPTRTLRFDAGWRRGRRMTGGKR